MDFDMNPGDILLFKAERDFISRLIAWGTESKYSHVAICVSAKMNLAIEAIARGGIRARDIRKIPRDYDIYRVKEDFSYNLDGVISYLVDKLNERYDYPGVIWLGFIKLLAKIGLPFKLTANNWQKRRDHFCSELCYQAFFHGGDLDIVPDMPEANITSPADISNSQIMESVE